MAQTIRLCTWNIQLGLQFGTILQAIQNAPDFTEIDLLALQEASVHSDQEDAHRIAEALGPHYESYQVTAHRVGQSVQANALVWNSARIHMASRATILLPRVRELSVSRAERALLGTLPQQPRASIVLDGDVGGWSLRVFVAHLDVLGLAHKREQFNYILSDARTRQPPVAVAILAGDLNTFRFRSHPSWAGIAAAAKREHFQDLTTEIVWTHHTIRRLQFRQKLDAIFVRSARPMQYHSWSLDIAGSDHIPVFAEITLA